MADSSSSVSSPECISVRSLRLNQMFGGRGKPTLCGQRLLTSETLLDALMALYDGCCSPTLRTDKNVAIFLENFRNVILEVRKMRVTICDFDVKKVIGHGHFGDVRVVRERNTDDVYAMKVLRKSEIMAQQNVAFYEEERDIMAKACSPWITRLHYAFQDALNLYLVMEYHPGGDLLGLLDRYDNHFSEDDARFYLAELVLAVHALHQMGYIHRDVKPDNVLIDRTGHIKLADFGSASRLTASGHVTNRMPVGTPDYIAPEVLDSLENSRGSYGHSCDWWSLGIVAYQMVYGVTPFCDDDVIKVYSNIGNFKHCLEFPDPENGEKLSAAMLGLMRGLMSSVSDRLDFESLRQHPFFSSTDWASLRDLHPPFIPVVTSNDDTSNFDDDCSPTQIKKSSRPETAGLASRAGFPVQNLPFVGFTYTQMREVEDHSVAPSSGAARLSTFGLERQLEDKKKELITAKQERSDTEKRERELRQDLERLKRQLQDQTDSNRVQERELERMTKQLTVSVADTAALRKLLEQEQADRGSTEKDALSLLVDIKDKWKKAEELRLEKLTSEIAKMKEFIEHQDEQFKAARVEVITLRKELTASQKTCEEAKVKLRQYRDRAKDSRRNSMNEILQLDVHQQQLSSVKEELEQAEATIAKLQNRLAATVELEVKIERLENDGLCDIDNRVDQLNTANMALQEQLARAKDESTDLKRDLQSKKDLLDESERHGRDMAVELEEQRRQIWDMMQQIGDANSPKVADFSFRMSARETKIKSRVQELEGQLSQCRDENDRLREELIDCRDSDHEKTQTVDHLRTAVERLETGMRRLDTPSRLTSTPPSSGPAKRTSPSNRVAARIVSPRSKTIESQPAAVSPAEKLYLESQVAKLEGQLDKAKEAALLDKQSLREVRLELFKRERELKDARLDLRIATREAKESAEQLAAIQERKTALAKGKESVESKNSEMQKSVAELENRLAKSSEQMVSARRDWDRQRLRLEERVNSLQSNVQELRASEAQLRETQLQARSSDREAQSLTSRVTALDADKSRLQQQHDKMERDLAEEKRERARIQHNYELLSANCVEMDEQMKELEEMSDMHEEEVAAVNSRLDASSKKIDTLLEELEDARRCVERERRATRAAVEEKNELQQQLDMRELIGETELHSAQEQTRDYRTAVSGLTQEIVGWENQVRQLEAEEAVLRSRAEALAADNTALKNEAGELLDNIQALRNTNFKVSHQLEEALAATKRAKEETAELELALQNAEYIHRIERIKMQETAAQHVKLIDFLQKNAENSNKKKTLPEKIFGRRERPKVPPIIIEHHHYSPPATPLKMAKPTTVVNGKDVTDCVGRDNSVNAAQTQEVLASLALSPGCQTEVMRSSSKAATQKPSNERMQHNIPHRFQVGLNLHPTKCAACLEGIHFGRYFSRCLECHIAVHDKCISTVAQACSLPLGLMQHYRQSMRASKSKTTTNSSSSKDGTLDLKKMEGWLKVPRKGNQGWERRHAKVEGTTLMLFKENGGSKRGHQTPTLKLELVSDNAAVRVVESTLPGELSGTAKCDLCFIFKLELQPLTTCWPGRSYYFMVSSEAEKLTWTCALENIIRKSRPCPIDDDLHSVILTFENSPSVDINCVCYLDQDHVLLGAEEGLYYVNLLDESCMRQQPTRLIKDFGAVGQMFYYRPLQKVVLTAGNKQTLYWIDLADIVSVCRGEVEFVADIVCMLHPVDDISSCHLFTLSKDAGETTAVVTSPFLCAATPQKVVILRWNPGLKAFSLRKTIPVDEPCSCALFTPNSLLVGTDKFYEVELENFFVEDFLDESDETLASHVRALPTMQSFPINIFQVSPNGVQEEYLLCFHEFGLFIDSFGQRSRTDVLKWTRLPLSFAFRWPYLYVIHFSSVEVYEIIVHKEKCFSVQTFVDIPSPRLLGLGLDSGTIVLATAKESMAKVLLLNGEAAIRRKSEKSNGLELLSIEEAINESGNSSNFSFSSSVMQALEQTDLQADGADRHETEL